LCFYHAVSFSFLFSFSLSFLSFLLCKVSVRGLALSSIYDKSGGLLIRLRGSITPSYGSVKNKIKSSPYMPPPRLLQSVCMSFRTLPYQIRNWVAWRLIVIHPITAWDQGEAPRWCISSPFSLLLPGVCQLCNQVLALQQQQEQHQQQQLQSHYHQPPSPGTITARPSTATPHEKNNVESCC